MPSPFVELLADLAGALEEVGAGWLARSTLRMLEEALGQSDLLPELGRAMDRAREGAPAKGRGARGRSGNRAR